mgnify:CR=1 FL=1
MPNGGGKRAAVDAQRVALMVEGGPGVPVPADSLREQLVTAQETKFSAWWGAFLLNALETLKSFRQFGDDEGQFLAWALATASLPSAGAAPRGALSLSEISVTTGIPLETARRHLLKMTQAGICRREGTLYAMSLPPDLRAEAMDRLAPFAAILRSVVDDIMPPRRGPFDEIDDRALRAYLQSGLRYCANLRRLLTRGAFIAFVVAAMLEIEGRIRLQQMLVGPGILSRSQYNGLVERRHDITLHATRIADLAGEPLVRARAAIKQGIELGFASAVGPDQFAFSAVAARIPEDNQAYTRGVKEGLADMLLALSDSQAPAIMTADLL